jgi:L-aspartate oxidase
VVRDERGLRRAQGIVDGWLAQPRTPRSQAEFEDENLLHLADATIRAALARRESVGAHYRSDDPSVSSHTSAPTAALVGSAGC